MSSTRVLDLKDVLINETKGVLEYSTIPNTQRNGRKWLWAILKYCIPSAWVFGHTEYLRCSGSPNT